ncbi:hypothetical protein V8E53_015481 [Lactarius tabidus]
MAALFWQAAPPLDPESEDEDAQEKAGNVVHPPLPPGPPPPLMPTRDNAMAVDVSDPQGPDINHPAPEFVSSAAVCPSPTARLSNAGVCLSAGLHSSTAGIPLSTAGERSSAAGGSLLAEGVPDAPGSMMTLTKATGTLLSDLHQNICIKFLLTTSSASLCAFNSHNICGIVLQWVTAEQQSPIEIPLHVSCSDLWCWLYNPILNMSLMSILAMESDSATSESSPSHPSIEHEYSHLGDIFSLTREDKELLLEYLEEFGKGDVDM